MGDLIAGVDRDDLLACLLWTGECRIADILCRAWTEHITTLHQERGEANHRSDGGRPAFMSRYYFQDTDDQVTSACRRAAAEVHEQLEKELAEANEASAESNSIRDKITANFGFDLSKRARREEDQGYTLDTLAVLGHQLEEAKSRLAGLLARDRECLHSLALTEAFRLQAARLGTTSTADIDTMTSVAFTAFIQRLLERDGHTVSAPAEAEDPDRLILAFTASGHRLAVIARHWDSRNHVSRPAEAVNTSMLHCCRRNAVAAGVEETIVVTNGAITRPARRFAAAQGIRLIDRTELQRWAEWGEPLTQGPLTQGEAA
ncbi:hypothetical protein AR457_41035 [Streptomyces agglomeratus]|nr:hypothetical protein AR457_41035 [Streptomyces agglomeratus]